MPDIDALDNEPSAGELTVEERFAIVPEWLLDADVSDAAIRRACQMGCVNGFSD